MNKIAEFFKFNQRNTSFRTESIGGITTFLAMSYILFVNPLILSDAGMDKGSVFTATAIAAVIGTLIMAVVANYPVALAPGMGMNAFFTYSVVLGMGFQWEKALAAIFVSGIIFMVVSASGIREKIINSIPLSLKHAVGTGIGFFIAFIGLQKSGIIVDNPSVLVGLGDLSNPATLLSIFGLILTIILYVRKVKAAIFIGIIVTSIVGIITNQIDMPNAVVSSVPSIKPTLFAIFDPLGDFSTYNLEFFIVVFTFLFVDFFDTAGTLIAVGTRANLIDQNGKLVDGGRALFADATATVAGSVLGTSSTTSYVESLTGVYNGARTGFASVVTALLFVFALFFSPLLNVVTSNVTAPALIMVGALMVNSFGHIDWDDIALTIPSFITVIMMLLSYSIANGIAAGFIIYTIIMIATNRAKEVHPIMFGLSLVFIIYFYNVM